MSLREEQRRRTRQRLQAAALEIFADVGYDAATIEQIAVAANTSRATFYAHYRNKQEVADAIATRGWSSATEALLELNRIADWSYASLRTWVGRVTARWPAMAKAARVLSTLPLSDRSSTTLNRPELFAPVLDGERWQRWSREEAEFRLRILHHVTSGYFAIWTQAGAQADPERDLDVIAALCWSALNEVPAG